MTTRAILRPAFLSAALLVLCATAAGASAAPTITEYPLLTSGRNPLGIAAGPDGNVWFAGNAGSGSIGRVTPGGTVSEFTVGLSGPAEGIALGPENDLWFTEPAQEKIGKITPEGVITEYPLPKTLLPSAKPAEIALGRDGNLWFTISSDPGGIGRITPGGVITEFTAGLSTKSSPQGIAAGPDGNLWFTESANPGRIGRITTAGVISEFTSGLTANSSPLGITAGPNGALWFTESANPGRIGKITTAGVITQYETGLPSNIAPEGITAGSDGNVYFTEFNNPGEIGRITPSGTISQIATPTANSQPVGIATGPNGNIWFTGVGNKGKVGQLTVAPSVANEGTSDVGETVATLTATVGANSQATEYRFEYGPTAGYGTSTPATSAGTGPTPTAVSADIGGLSPSSTYHFRTVATNASGTTYGPDQTFMTATPPAASTLAAMAISLTGATLRGAVNPEGQETTYHFDWGTSTKYGSKAPLSDETVGSDTSEHALEQTLTGLAPDTVYHYRVVASNCGGCTEGTVYGPDQTFTTAPAPNATTGQANAITQYGATITGTVNPNGAATSYDFDWGTSTGYGNLAPLTDAPVGADETIHQIAQTLTGLLPGTVYHYRLVASDCGGCATGTTYGKDETFTTETLALVAGSGSPLETPLPAPTAAPPVLGSTALVRVVSGVVLVQPPGARTSLPLDGSRDVPVGSVIDARHGVVNLTTAVGRGGRTQAAMLWQGIFTVTQGRTAAMTTFTLPAPSGCPTRARRASRSAAFTAKHRKPAPSLWAKDNHGQFSTKGQNSVATVRGTFWVTTNGCTGTRTTVKQGSVRVRDLRRHRTVIVHAGHSYLARS